MPNVSFHRATLLAALLTVACVVSASYGQESDSRPSATPSIRPFQRSETSANQAPNLYDKTSDQFDYFRRELGRKELSSKARARLEQRAARVVYDDPMDKPAYDGSPFVNIYSSDNILSDGEPFVGADDPDEIYRDVENNLLARLAEAFNRASLMLRVAFGDGGAVDSGKGMSDDPYDMSGSAALGMPTISPIDADMTGYSEKDGPSPSATKTAPVKDNPNDDAKTLFPDGPVDNPFKDAKLELDDANDLSGLFSADREFVAKAPATSGSGYGMYGGTGGNATEGMGGSEEMMKNMSKPVVEP